ncbi:hypothetical protein AGMMS4956_14870 [Bacteroidia bacterium]|nr:hypothetical protein AGMMS4956_14870 [Bacteroidia bacterium]
MTVEEFLHIAPPDANVTLQQLEQLALLATQKEWFADAQILLLKAMKQHNYPNFEQRLGFASLYATHREQLSAYLQSVQNQALQASHAHPEKDDDRVEWLDE